MSMDECIQCFSLVLGSLLGAVQSALHCFEKDHDYLRICGETAHAISAVLQPSGYMLLCRQHAAPGQHQPAAVEVGGCCFSVPVLRAPVWRATAYRQHQLARHACRAGSSLHAFGR